jgi:hypothetical protein
VLLVPTTWLLAQARRTGFRDRERSGIALAWLLPLAGFITGAWAEVSIATPAAVGLLAPVLRRVVAIHPRGRADNG